MHHWVFMYLFLSLLSTLSGSLSRLSISDRHFNLCKIRYVHLNRTGGKLSYFLHEDQDQGHSVLRISYASTLCLKKTVTFKGINLLISLKFLTEKYACFVIVQRHQSTFPCTFLNSNSLPSYVNITEIYHLLGGYENRTCF